MRFTSISTALLASAAVSSAYQFEAREASMDYYGGERYALSRREINILINHVKREAIAEALAMPLTPAEKAAHHTEKYKAATERHEDAARHHAHAKTPADRQRHAADAASALKQVAHHRGEAQRIHKNQIGNADAGHKHQVTQAKADHKEWSKKAHGKREALPEPLTPAEKAAHHTEKYKAATERHEDAARHHAHAKTPADRQRHAADAASALKQVAHHRGEAQRIHKNQIGNADAGHKHQVTQAKADHKEWSKKAHGKREAEAEAEPLTPAEKAAHHTEKYKAATERHEDAARHHAHAKTPADRQRHAADAASALKQVAHHRGEAQRIHKNQIGNADAGHKHQVTQAKADHKEWSKKAHGKREAEAEAEAEAEFDFGYESDF